jgi:hypothetical protein
MRIDQLVITTLAALAISGCGQNTDQPEAPDETTRPAIGTTTTYKWYMELTTPAGQSVVVRTGDGRVTNESFVHWNNREYTVNSEIQLDADGMVVAQKITGISPFQAPIDESFTYMDGVATWSSVGDSGSATTDTPAFYLPNQWGSVGAMEALVRAAGSMIDGEIPLFPTGSARVERVKDVEVDTGSGMEVVSLYSISGTAFTPIYAWFDADMRLAAFEQGGWLGMIPEDWDVSALGTLSKIQTQESATRIEAQTGGLARSIEQPLLFANVDVVDVENGITLHGYNVLVEAGTITHVSQDSIEADGAIVVDGAGKTLIPGLWDMHGHFNLEDGVLNIAGGITNVRDIGNVHEKIMTATEKYDSGEVIGPNTYRSGFMDKAGPYASGWAAESLEDALERVDFFAEHGYGQIKLYSSILPKWVAPIAERTHSHGMRLSGHIPAFMSAEQAVEAGYDEIQHINMVFLNFLVGDKGDTRQQIRFTTYGDEAANLDLDSEEVNNFMTLLRDNDVVVDATAAIFDTMLLHKPGDPDPTFAAVIDHLPPGIARPMYSPDMVLGENWPRSAVKQSAMLLKLYESGIQIVPGSDYYAAFTLHRELELYAEAGIPNAAVLKMATLDSARIVGVDDHKGSIAVGKDADLVLLDGNPLQDMSAVRRATLVMKGDTVYRPDELYRAVGVTPFVESTTF